MGLDEVGVITVVTHVDIDIHRMRRLHVLYTALQIRNKYSHIYQMNCTYYGITCASHLVRFIFCDNTFSLFCYGTNILLE